MNIAQIIQQALGLFTTKAHPVVLAAPVPKVRKIGYGETLRAARTAKQREALFAKHKAQ